jgi:hypothetical protein
MIKFCNLLVIKSIIYFICLEMNFIFRYFKYLFNFFKDVSFFKYLIYRKKDYRILRNTTQKRVLEKNYSFWKKSIKKKDGQDNILITSLLDVKSYCVGEATIGKSLSKILNKNSVALIKEHDFKAEILINSYDVDKIYYLPNGNFLSRFKFLFKSIELIKDLKTTDDLISLKYENIDIGIAVYDHYIRFTGKGSEDLINYKMVCFLSKSLLIQDFLNHLFKLNYFKEVIQAETQFIPAQIVFQNALINKCKVFSRIGLDNEISVMIFDDFKNRYKDRYCYSKDLVNSTYNNYNNNISNKIEHLMTERFKGNAAYSSMHNVEENMTHKNKNIDNLDYNYNKNSLCEKLNWDINKPIVVLFASDLTDGVFKCNWKIFKDNLTGIRETINIIKEIKDINWLIKPHPNDIKLKIITTTEKEVLNLSSEYEHLKLFPKNFGNGPLPKIISAAVSMSGSAGFEYPALGVPSIISTGTIYTGYGFTYEGNTINEFKKILKNADKLTPLSIEQITKAKTFIYIHEFLTKVVSSLIPEKKVDLSHKHINYWENLEKLIDGYNFDEDSFYQNLKIQLEKNDLHTINYNFLQ